MRGRASKAKGYRGEKEFIEVLHESGWADAKRNGNIHGRADQGDASGVPGWAFQVKNVETARIPEFLKAAQEQAASAGAPWFGLVLKLRGKHIRDGAFVMPVWLAMRLIREVDDEQAEAAYADGT